jgi:hypothetical protein
MRPHRDTENKAFTREEILEASGTSEISGMRVAATTEVLGLVLVENLNDIPIRRRIRLEHVGSRRAEPIPAPPPDR